MLTVYKILYIVVLYIEMSVWGVIGQYTNWSSDILMNQTSPGSNIYVATMPTDFSGDFKFRQNQSWTVNYGGSWPTSNVIANGSNITAPALPSGSYYTFTLNLNAGVFLSMVTNSSGISTSSIYLTIIPKKTYGDAPFTITTPITNSPGSFTYTSSNASVATIVGNVITIVGAGTSTITAIQAASGNYASNTASTTLQVTTYQALSMQRITGTTFNLTYTLSPTEIQNTITANPGGFFIIRDNTDGINLGNNTNNQTDYGNINVYVTNGNQLVFANRSVPSSGTKNLSIDFNIGPPNYYGYIFYPFNYNIIPTITNFVLPIKTHGNLPFTITPPTSDSPGSFTYTSSNSSIATISGNTIIVKGIGACTITATQAASPYYISGSISAPFQVVKPYLEFSQPITIQRSSQPIVTPRFMMSGLFSDNSQVYYKNHSLASGGVGSVSNSRRKARRT